MKKDKGFTLIELLAIIVILAIIALIATPLVLNVINDVKVGSFRASTHGIVSSAEQGYSLKMIKGEPIQNTIYDYENGEIKSQLGNIEIKYKGSKPNYGTWIVNLFLYNFYKDNCCLYATGVK